MMRPGKGICVYLHREPVDFRKSINGLSVLVEQSMELDVFQPALFVFCNRHRDKIKVLYWERNGFCLWYKRLEKERFKWPMLLTKSIIQLSGQELNWLLDGFDLWNNKPHQTLFYQSVNRG